MRTFVRRRWRWLAVGLALLALAGAALAIRAPARVELWAHEQQWRGRRPASYQYVVRTGCYCPVEITRPLLVVVREGKPAEARDAETDEPQLRGGPVDGLFAMAADALGSADRVQIAYDPTYGFPTLIAVDSLADAVDDETSVLVERFEPLP
jgi:hypothetical protein